MAAPISRKGTCIIKLPDAITKDKDNPVTRKEIIENVLKKIDWKTLKCVQLMPNFFTRISFKSEEAKDIFIQRGFTIRGVQIAIQDADPRVNFVYIHHLPTEVSDQALSEYPRSFGKVASIQRQHDRETIDLPCFSFSILLLSLFSFSNPERNFSKTFILLARDVFIYSNKMKMKNVVCRIYLKNNWCNLISALPQNQTNLWAPIDYVHHRKKGKLPGLSSETFY